eukprot:2376772-Rhodomonas_salina.3
MPKKTHQQTLRGFACSSTRRPCKVRRAEHEEEVVFLLVHSQFDAMHKINVLFSPRVDVRWGWSRGSWCLLLRLHCSDCPSPECLETQAALMSTEVSFPALVSSDCKSALLCRCSTPCIESA